MNFKIGGITDIKIYNKDTGEEVGSMNTGISELSFNTTKETLFDGLCNTFEHGTTLNADIKCSDYAKYILQGFDCTPKDVCMMKNSKKKLTRKKYAKKILGK